MKFNRGGIAWVDTKEKISKLRDTLRLIYSTKSHYSRSY